MSRSNYGGGITSRFYKLPTFNNALAKGSENGSATRSGKSGLTSSAISSNKTKASKNSNWLQFQNKFVDFSAKTKSNKSN